jgi:hypothetical protein
MPLDAAEGGISIAEHNLAVTLATTARFQSFVGVATLEEAWARVHFTAWPAPADGDVYNPVELNTLLPSALIYTDEASGWSLRKVGQGATQEAGMVMFCLEELLTEELSKDVPGSERRFKNTVGVICKQMMDLSEQGPYIALTELIQVEICRLSKGQQVNAETQRATIIATWGTPR